MKTLKTQLKSLLTQENISENELARRTGIAQQVINRMLSGENTNPKIGTLTPLAKYFDISISELLGESDESCVPFIDWRLLDQLNDSHPHTKKATHHMFETCLLDQSMEPKFYLGTRLIFDRNLVPVSGDFVLINVDNSPVIFRQLLIKQDLSMTKCLNPSHPDYQLRQLTMQARCLATLVQTRNHQ